MNIPLSNPLSQYLAHKNEIDEAVARTFAHGHYILGPAVEAFEKEFAAYVGTKHAVGVANGTEALQLALLACGIEAGDEVITVSHTAVATVAAIELAGGVPVLVDVEKDTYCIDPEKIRGAVSSKTKAVVAVHLYGQACDLDALVSICREHKLKLIEDCAQAHGARYGGKRVGSFGDAAAFSFYPTKNLGAIGDGGAVVTSNDLIAKRLGLLRQYGWKDRYQSQTTGMNSRLDELQAAILRIKLKTLDKSNDARVTLAGIYREHLPQNLVSIPSIRANSSHVYHLYVIQTKNRSELQKRLSDAGIGTGIHYPVPIHQQPAYVNRLRCPGGLSITESLASSILSLPMYPELEADNVRAVCDAIRQTSQERAA